MQVDEEFQDFDPLAIVVFGETDSDPVIQFTKSVLNNTGTTWLGFEIGLNGGGNTFVANSATSDKFTLTSETSNLLTFGLPSPVASGETVSFTFQLNIPSTGPFDLRLTQKAIVPEPATVTLAAVGSCLAWLFMRRRAAW